MHTVRGLLALVLLN